MIKTKIELYMKFIKVICYLLLLLFVSCNVYAKSLQEIQAQFGRSSGKNKRNKVNIKILSDKEVDKLYFSESGKKFIDLYGGGWKHARTGNFIFHYRKKSDMKKLADNSEKMYAKITSDLSSNKRSDSEIDIYVMDDEHRWKRFISKFGMGPNIAGFASGEEIFLYLDWGSTKYRAFSLRLLAHELTHIIFHRIYGGSIPLWLNEGFAEYQEDKVSSYIKQAKYSDHKEMNTSSFYDIDDLVEIEIKPSGNKSEAFYLQSKRLVGYIYNKYGKEKFLVFTDKMCKGYEFKDVVMELYGDKVDSYKIFKSRANKYK